MLLCKSIRYTCSIRLDVLADMFFNSTFDEEELNKERNVVCEEIKMYEDTPDDIVHDLLSESHIWKRIHLDILF